MGNKLNSVFIACSIDGYIADKHGGLDWLNTIPNPNRLDMGYSEFIKRVDAIIMGRKTFETVCSFDGEWPYALPVFVISNTLTSIAKTHKQKAELIRGDIPEIISQVNERGLSRLYIDGGTTIQSFLNADLIDELIITTIPILLGGGSPLFGKLECTLNFELKKSTVFLNEITQNHYRKKKS